MKKVLLIRLDKIGDFVLFTGALPGYRRLYPGHRLDLVCSPAVAELARSCPLLGRVLPLDETRFHGRSPGAALYTLRLLARLNAARYDVIVHAAACGRYPGDMIARFVSAREKIAFDLPGYEGYPGQQARRGRIFTQLVRGAEGSLSEIERNLELVRALGDVGDLSGLPWIRPAGESDPTVEEILSAAGLAGGDFALMSPGARQPERLWPAANWAALADRVIREGVTRAVLFTGTREEGGVITSILEKTGAHRDRCFDLSGRLGIGQLLHMMHRARLVVSVESGTIHMAAALGVPNICLLGGGHFGRFYPYGDPGLNRAVYSEMDCFGCDWQCRYEHAICMEGITLEAVRSALSDLIKKGGKV